MNNQPPVPRRSAPRQRATTSAMERRLEGTTGMELDVLLRGLARQTKAKRAIYTAKDGRITDIQYVPDNHARYLAITTGLTLWNAFPAKQVSLDGTVRIEQLQAVLVGMRELPTDQLDALADDAPLALPAEVVKEAQSDDE